MKILLIEDEQRVASFIKKGLQEHGHLVVQAFDGSTGLNLARQHEFEVIILDIIMPDMNGLEVCATLRNVDRIDTPVLMLTALGTTDDVVMGLDNGADDYLIKPFKFKELLARLNALIRRKVFESNIGVLKVQDLEMKVEEKLVTRAGKAIDLTAREFRLLEFLLKNKNRVVTRTSILENVWDINFDLGTNVVEVYINYLRKKVDKGFSFPLIKTVVGMGYTIRDTE